MKSKKQSPPPDPIEYRLVVGRRYDEIARKEVVDVILLTAKEFRNFRYNLVVKESVSGGTVRFVIEGLQTPQPALPGAGPAEFRRTFRTFPESLKIVVSKLDGTENEFDLKFRSNGIEVLAAPRDPFIELSTDLATS